MAYKSGIFAEPTIRLKLQTFSNGEIFWVQEERTMVDGQKADLGKDRIDLFPGEALFAISRVLTFGAQKYADRNWELGIKYGRVFAALMRHMWAWWQGKGPTTVNFLFGSLDTETKMSHLWHAGCCIVFLITYEERGMTQFDDRPGMPTQATSPYAPTVAGIKGPATTDRFAYVPGSKQDPKWHNETPNTEVRHQCDPVDYPPTTVRIMPKATPEAIRRDWEPLLRAKGDTNV